MLRKEKPDDAVMRPFDISLGKWKRFGEWSSQFGKAMRAAFLRLAVDLFLDMPAWLMNSMFEVASRKGEEVHTVALRWLGHGHELENGQGSPQSTENGGQSLGIEDDQQDRNSAEDLRREVDRLKGGQDMLLELLSGRLHAPPES